VANRCRPLKQLYESTVSCDVIARFKLGKLPKTHYDE